MKRARWYEYVAAIAIGVPCVLVVLWLGDEAEQGGVALVDNWIGFVATTVCLFVVLLRQHRWALRRPPFLAIMTGLLLLQVAAFIAALRVLAFTWRAPWWGAVFLTEFVGVNMALDRLGYPAGSTPRRTDSTRKQ